MGEVSETLILNPRHRRYCQLAASGLSRKLIAEQLGYTPQNCTLLASDPLIQQEILRLQDEAFAGGLKQRFVARQHYMMDVIERQVAHPLTKPETKIAAAQWWLEQVKGKAVAVHDVGENLLRIVHEQLDRLTAGGATIDVTPLALRAGAASEAAPVSEEERKLDEWLNENP